MIIGFIPVRGGSKSIPYKNIKLLAGKPLVCHVIDAALGATLINKVVVATDAEYIKELILNYYPNNSRVEVYDRDPLNATDTASTESVMLEYANVNQDFNQLVLIQATSPLIKSHDLHGALEKYLQHKEAGGLLSVVRQKRFIWEEKSNGEVQAKNYDFQNRPRRQDFEGYLVENGAFYITSRQLLLQNQCRISNPVIHWEMLEESYVELDEPHDWLFVEQLIKNKLKPSIKGAPEEIKLFLTDVDGVLTDAGMYYSENGDEQKKFNTRDGKAFELLRNAGIKTGIITAENTKIVERRAAKIKADYLYQGVVNKVEILNEILAKTGFKASEVAYIGDDLNDVGIIGLVGLSACPQDAVEDVRQQVNKVLNTKGGAGCVREFAELILARQ